MSNQKKCKSSLSKKCLFCKQSFYKLETTSRKAWESRTKFCSKNCKHKYQKGKPSPSPNTTFKKGNTPWLKGVHNPHIVGDKNPNWKGGVTKVQAQLRKCYKYRTWRREVFERDNYTCVECGTRGGDKNADHYPISFAQHLRRIQEENDGKLLFENALKDTSLWDINNGRTLCIGCHKETDNYLKPITT